MYLHWPGIWSYINNGFSMRGLLRKILQPWTLRCIIFPLVITDLYIFYKSFLAVKCLGGCLFLTVTIWTSSGAQMMQGFFYTVICIDQKKEEEKRKEGKGEKRGKKRRSRGRGRRKRERRKGRGSGKLSYRILISWSIMK